MRADERLAPDLLDRVKKATVYLRVTLPDNTVVQGSGFFGFGQNLVLTNAHVLGMLRAESEKPKKVEVIVNSGEKDEQTVLGQVLGVDQLTDLAVVRVQGKGFPQSLPVHSTKNLRETDPVFIFGFPFGENLGRNITISKSSVSSLRKDASGLSVQQVQVNGGMSPGNSGGPIIDDKGQVVGVAVSGIRNTTINFAIPGEKVVPFLLGRSTTQIRGLPFKDGDKVKVPVYANFLDPLGRIKEVWYDVWTGDPGKERDSRLVKPERQPGDSERTKVMLTYKNGQAQGEITLPNIPPGKVCWRQLMFNSGAGLTWSGGRILTIPPPVELKPVVVSYKQPGSESKWKLTTTSTLKLRDEDDVDHALSSTLSADLVASAAKTEEGDRATMNLKLSKIEVAVTLDKKPVGDTKDDASLAKESASVGALLQIGKNGDVLRSAANLKGLPKASQRRWISLSDRILQAIDGASFPLPGTEVTTSKSWTGKRVVPVGTIGSLFPAQAELTYVYKGTWTRAGREEAIVEFTGVIEPQKLAFLHVSGKIKGEAYIDLATGTTVRSTSTVDLDLTTKTDGQTSRASGTLEIRLERRVPN